MSNQLLCRPAVLKQAIFSEGTSWQMIKNVLHSSAMLSNAHKIPTSISVKQQNQMLFNDFSANEIARRIHSQEL